MNFDDLKKQGQDHLNENKDEYIQQGKDYVNDRFGNGENKDNADKEEK
ncbi:hypothetical protein [Macrococcus sp. DPC7161]|nr:hypothetical protein [Macrococcus sp. DPC7161]